MRELGFAGADRYEPVECHPTICALSGIQASNNIGRISKIRRVSHGNGFHAGDAASAMTNEWPVASTTSTLKHVP
jgi:hypothetical protein